MVDYIIGDSRLLELIDKYSVVAGEQRTKASEIICKLAQNVQNPELIVPVLGSQGMGKSTLINAILGVNILPNDADETTCVPVEIRYGTKEKAVVYFQSGETAEIELSCDSLREFVDNNENDGNEKCVSHIALETPSDLLKTGLVIVDLPGVGSLTQNNHETTMRYIRKLCTAIFVIPTVPTIRRSEEVFIRGAWSSFSSAIFVQNRWDDETDQEVNDSVAFNSLVLNKIAKNANTTFNGKICVVNAYKAILSRLHNDSAECERSNLPKLLSELENLGKNRINLETANLKAKVSSYIDTAQAAIMQYVAESQMNEEQLKAERERIREEFNSATNEIQQLVDDLLECVDEEKNKADIFVGELSRTSAENLRADIRKLIDSGIVDGDQLTEAFSDYQEKYLLDAVEQHYDYMNTMTYEFEKKLEVLSEKIHLERASSFEAQKFENGQAFKFEKGMKIGIDVASAIGGGWIGTTVGAWTGAELGAVIGSAAGPVGTVVGIIAGIGVAVVGSLLGKKAKNEITAKRGAQAKRAIEPLIEEFQEKIYLSISSNTNTVMDDIAEVLQSYMEDRRTYYADMMRSKEQAADVEYQVGFDVSELNEHYAYLESKKEALK